MRSTYIIVEEHLGVFYTNLKKYYLYNLIIFLF